MRIIVVKDVKDRIMRSIEKFNKRSLPKAPGRPRKRNGAPEKEVEAAVTTYLKQNNFHYTVIDSKAVYSQAAGRLRSEPVRRR